MALMLIILSLLVFLLSGLLASFICSKLKFSDAFPLMFIGGLLAFLFPQLLSLGSSLQIFSVLALAIVGFDVAVHLRFHEYDFWSWRAFWYALTILLFVSGIFFVLGVFVSPIAVVPFLLVGFLALSRSVFHDFKGSSRVLQVLHVSSRVLTAFGFVLFAFLSFILLTFSASSPNFSFSLILQLFVSLAFSIGVGVVAGVIIFLFTANKRLRFFVPWSIVLLSLLSFFVAEFGNGSGLIAVLSFGFFFANVNIRHKIDLLSRDFSLMRFGHILFLTLFGAVLIALFSYNLLVVSLFVVALLMASRFAVGAFIFHKNFSLSELFVVALRPVVTVSLVVVSFALLVLPSSIPSFSFSSASFVGIVLLHVVFVKSVFSFVIEFLEKFWS